MKFHLVLTLLICTQLCRAQIAPFEDYSGYFRTFYKNSFRQLEFQRIQNFQAGDNLLAYVDTRLDFKLYDGNQTQLITNQIVKYQLSDNILGWKIANAIFCYENGKKQMLTGFGADYVVKDSLIVFQDTRYNNVNVFYKDQIYPIYSLTGELYMPDYIGDNIVAFRDNGEFYKIFWRGQIYDIGVWTNGMHFSAGSDIAVFNDPNYQSFSAFEKGEIVDIEPVQMSKYKAARNFAIYEDLNQNLMIYQNGKKEQLSNFSTNFWDANDDIAIWKENTRIYAYYQGRKTEVSTYTPADYKIKNGVYAFRNIMGGVSAFVEGKVYEITNQMDAKYEIYGNTILVELFNKDFIVFSEGKEYKP